MEDYLMNKKQNIRIFKNKVGSVFLHKPLEWPYRFKKKDEQNKEKQQKHEKVHKNM